MRNLISLYYALVLGAPPEEEWDGHDGTISTIMMDLKIPHGSRDLIRTVLARTDEAVESGEMYDGSRKKGSGGHNVIIKDAIEIKKILDYSEFQSLSHFEISVIINTDSADMGQEHVSVASIRTCIERHQPSKTLEGSRKQGKLDPDSFWAIGRLQLLCHYLIRSQTDFHTPARHKYMVDTYFRG